MNTQSKYIKKRMPDKGSGGDLTGNVLCRMLIALFMAMLLPIGAAQAANPDPTGKLRIEIISAYNLVVDSNVTTPATYAPEAATLGAKVCNDGSEVMNEAQVYIGDYAGKAPGTYPVFNSAGDSRSWLGNTGTYSLTHESGSFASVSDASRAWIGTLQPGECRVEYWVVSYPRCVNVDDGSGTYIGQEPPCATAITGGSTTADDLALSYDIWATGSYEGAALEAEDSRDLTLRSEISAAANKIWPNGDNKVPEEYKAAIAESFGWDTWTPTGSNPFPGQVFETQGIWYDLGNVNKGFDNNNDGVPDQNAWLQPVGIPDVYDPGCFRLVGTYGLLIVKLSSGGEQLIPFKDQMYFENIPDNTGVVGLVFYEYAALNGKCTGTLTPYQEVASGSYNEKFSGDYGTAFQITTQEPLAYITKNDYDTSGNLDPLLSPGSNIVYQLAVTNPDNSVYGGLAITVGDPDSGNPLVIRDTIPAGTNYVLGSAQVAADSDIATEDVTILYTYKNATTTWTSSTAPTTLAEANQVIALEWRAETGLTSSATAGVDTVLKVQFEVTVPGGYTEPFVSNTGCAAIGSGPCFDEDDAVTLIEGTKTISGTVFLDDSGTTGDGTAANGVMDGSEAGEGSVTVTLYYDKNGDGVLDPEDVKWGETTTDPTTGDYSFTTLPDAKFIAVVDTGDTDLTPGVAATTETELPADTTSGDVTGIDFGFLPPLEVKKVAVDGAGPYGDGETITYKLQVKNILPGGTLVPGGCYYDVFPENTAFITNTAGGYVNPTNIGSRDGVYGYADLGTAATDTVTMAIGAFKLPAKYDGNITDVNVIFHDSREIEGSVETSEYSTSVTINSVTYTNDPDPLLISDILDMDHEQNLNANPAPTWTQLADASAVLSATKKGSPSGNWEIDAYALRVYTDKPCAASSSDIITEVRLQDEYNNTQLSYQSSSPERDSWIDSGTTTTQVWDNLGPLAPGESKVVTVTMKGINGTTGTLNDIQNTARVADGDAKMGDGRIVNSGEATAEVYLVPAIDISGTLFSDKNSDGWDSTTGDNSAVDTYLPGQTVELWACATDVEPREVLVTGDSSSDCDSNADYNWYPIATTITADDGSYIFEGVTQGYYFVKAPDTAYDAGPTAGPADENSPQTGDDDDVYWWSPVNTTTNSGGGANTLNAKNLSGFFQVGDPDNTDAYPENWADSTNVDFGYGITTGAVSGYIWEDVNGNGEQEDGENGLSGITVQLTDPNTGNVLLDSNGDPLEIITDANGFYEFTGLPDGQGYRINVLTQGETGATGTLATDTWTPTQETIDGADPNPGNDATIDGDINFTASGGQVLFDRNFGYQPPNDSRQIDGTIYYDLDGDGTQGANEPGVEGLTVSLYQDEDGDGVVDPGTDALYTNVTTNPDGSYSFPDLPSQNFIVVVDDTPIGTYQQIEDPDVAPGGGVCVGTQCDGDGKADVTGGNVTGLDFGYQPPQDENAISGLVWTDLDADTVQNSSAEKGIGDVTVTLQWTPDGGTTWFDLDTQPASDGTTDVDGDGTTDPVGSYYFGDLPNGTYRVAVSETDANLPKGLGDAIYTPTTGTDEGTTRYFEQTLSGSTTSENNNFGFTPTGVIGDSIYWDVNGDGTQGTNEPRIENVTVELYTFDDLNDDGRYNADTESGTLQATGATKITDADGKYLFTGLEDDNYLVKVSDGPGTPIDGADKTADPDSDGLLCTDSALTVPCDSRHGVSIDGNSYMGADFGYKPPLFIGDQLFIDTNNSGGDMDATDVAIPYVTVTLTDCGTDGVCGTGDDVPVATTETDENGNYAFVDGMVDGRKYTVTVDTGDSDFPIEYGTLTPSYNGHDSDGSTNSSIELTLGSAPVDDADLGYQFTPVNDLSGTICLEGTSANGYCGTGINATNGIDPNAEVAYEGTTVYVSKWTDANNDGKVDAGELVPITQTVTDADGNYAFTGLPSVSGTDESYLVSLDAPADLLELTTTAAVTPADSLKEYTDPTSGYTTSAWQSITPITTNTEGLDFAFEQTVAFDFGDLPLPFETTLGIDGARHVVPATLNLYLGGGVTAESDGKPSAGANADEDDGIVPVDPTDLTSCTAADPDSTWNTTVGGAVKVTAVGDGWLVGWIDFNGDGSLNGSGEMIINEALSGGDTPKCIAFSIPADAVDGGGNFKAPGYARFRFFPKDDPALSLPRFAFKGKAKNGEVEDYLFNLSASSSIGDSILLDTDGDGTPDQGIEGAVVELQNAYCNPGVDCPTAVTDANGKYLFTGLGTGEYTVVVKSLPSGLPAGTQQIYDPDFTLDAQTVVNITAPGTEYLDADFWYGPNVQTTTGTIGDTVWNDANNNGKQDLGESGIGGITVVLKDSAGNPVLDSNGNSITTATNPDGSYLLTGVPAGTNYTVEVSNPPGGTSSTTGGETATVDVAAGQTVLTADFGYLFPEAGTSDIGDTIYHEDTGAGIAGVTVVLKDTNGDIIAQDVTDSTGKYLFPGLPPGDYTVEVTDTNGQLDSYVLNSYPAGTNTAGNPSYPLTTVGGTDYLDVDLGYKDPVPTYAVVSAFNAYVNAKNQVVLEWKTASEIGTIGFLLERLNEQSGKYQAVNTKLLPGMLSPPHGGTYRFVDTQAEPGRRYTYRIVEVAVHDRGTVSGPYTVQASAALPVNTQMFAGQVKGYTLTHQNFSRKQLKRFAARDVSEMRLASAKKKQTGTTLKIPVSKDGPVYLSAAELAAASGLSEEQVVKYVKSKKCLVTLAGTSVPVIAANTGSGFWFYGRAPERNDIGQNIYLLELGEKGVKMKNTPGRAEEVVTEEQSFTAHVKIEENHEPFHLYINTPVNDFWAWEYLMPYSGYNTVTHMLDVPYSSGHGTAVVTVNLVGVMSTGSSGAVPYKIAVLLNDISIGTAEWSAVGDYQFRAEVPANLLSAKDNEVKLVSQLNSGTTYSLIYFESIELDYERDYQAVNGELVFSDGGYKSVTVQGFSGSDVLALDITDPDTPVRVRTLPGKNDLGEYTATVRTEPGHEYFITENIAFTVSGELVADKPSDLKSSAHQADYLVISPLNLTASAERLVQLRESQGLKSMLVDIEDIQDEFSNSLAAPEAVHDFLAYVYEHWTQVPKYVVLIGDGSYDYRNYLDYGYPLVPSLLVQTPDGFFPSDNAFADVVGNDRVPEFAIGRIPVVNTAELDRYIDKLTVYEQSLSKRDPLAVVVTDRKDLSAGDFLASGDKVAALMPEGFAVQRLDVDMDTLGENGVHNGIVTALEQGADILHYIGHSSLVAYGRKNSLLTADDIDVMERIGTPMLMVSMACSTASFGYPPMNSIGESAVLKADGAAVGFYGATGLSLNYQADIIAKGFYTSLFDPANTRVGDAVVQGKQDAFAQGAEAYTLDIYNLLGDPAMPAPKR